jgi:hypothetical protein
MSELIGPFVDFNLSALLVLLVRLVVAFALGSAIAAVYRISRPMSAEAESFVVTLVLLTILIAMVTQVIGDNVARAFSLVGALSIVRFRTVVRDTQDTAYVIFAVAVGMAVGANHPLVALCGLGVVAAAAILMTRRRGAPILSTDGDLPLLLTMRLTLGLDPEALIRPWVESHVTGLRFVSVATARQGLSIDAVFKTALRADASAGALVNDLNRLEGVQAVTLQQAAVEEL